MPPFRTFTETPSVPSISPVQKVIRSGLSYPGNSPQLCSGMQIMVSAKQHKSIVRNYITCTAAIPTLQASSNACMHHVLLKQKRTCLIPPETKTQAESCSQGMVCLLGLQGNPSLAYVHHGPHPPQTCMATVTNHN
jgi:hypothetical protein